MVDEQQHPKSSITIGEAIEQWLEVAELEETTRGMGPADLADDGDGASGLVPLLYSAARDSRALHETGDDSS
jgi:hypothetical protein